MDLPTLMQSLGGSLFTEDFSGDLEAIEEHLEETERQLRLCRAALHALKGNLKDARFALEALSRSPNLPRHWALRCASFSAFFTYLRRYPPLLRFRPELGGIWDETRMHELNYFLANKELDEKINAYSRPDVPTDVYKFEAQLMQFLLVAPLALWNGAFRQHAAYPNLSTDEEETKQAFNSAISKLEYFRSIAHLQGWTRLQRYTERLQLEFHCGSSLCDGNERLKHAVQTCQQQNDQAGLAVLKMLCADNIVSPPFSSPLALNLVPIDSDDPGKSNVRWDALEDRLQLVNSSEAQTLYNESIQAFQSAGAPRGQAAVLLRQGCIEHMEAISRGPERSLEWSESLQSVAQKFEKASQLCGGDAVSSQLVNGHRLLLNISTGASEGIIEEAANLGRWGRETEDEGIPHFLGWLMMRFGRRQELEGARMDVALKCYQCARRCFQELEDDYAAFQAHVAEVQLYTDWYSYKSARSMVDNQLVEFYAIVSRLEELGNDPAREQANYPLLRQNLITVYGSIVSQIYRQADQPVALEAWTKKRRQLNEYAPSKTALITAAKLNKNLTGDEMMEESLDDIIDWEQRDQVLVDTYHATCSKYHSLLQDGCLLEAESALQDFTIDATSGNASAYTTGVLRILAYFQLGACEQCKNILEQFDDAKLLETRTADVPTITALWWRSRYNKVITNVQSAENAIALCAMSRDWVRGDRILREILDFSPGFMDITYGVPSFDPWNRLGWAGMVAEHNCQPANAFKWLLEAAKLVEVRRDQGIDLEARRGLYSPLPVAEIFAGLARICLQCAQAEIPVAVLNGLTHGHASALTWSEHALLFLEQANARCLLDSLALQDSKARDDTDAAARLYARRRREELLALPEVDRDAEQIRELLELDQFLGGYELYPRLDRAVLPDANPQINPRDIYASIGDDTVVLEIMFTRSGSALFAISGRGIEFAQYYSTRDVDVRRHVIRAMKELKMYDPSNKSSSRESLDCSLGKIADILLKPIQKILDSKPRVIFITSQPITAFPFAALPLQGRPLCLQKAVSHVPSLSTLLKLVGSDPVHPSLLSISKANGKKNGNLTVEQPLPMAGIEAVTSACRFNTEAREGAELDRASFRQMLKQNNIILLGTHGFLSPHSPWLSYVSLKEKFRVLDLAEAKSQAVLIIFSACVSGLGTATMTNDVMGFTHAVLSTGSRAYIGSLWKVNDVATMFLIAIFFRLLSQIRDPQSLDELWAQSQRELYHMDNGKATELIEELEELWAKTECAGAFDPNTLLPDGGWYLDYLKRRVKRGALDLDFKHPYIYASLTLMGCGSTLFLPSHCT